MARAQNTFSVRIREALAQSGKTQEALAREVGVSLRTVQGWVSGAEPKGQQLVRLSFALNREPGWFFSEPDEREAA